MFTIILIKTNGFVVSTRDTEEKAREFVRLARIPKRNIDTASAGGTIAAFIYRENILMDVNAPESAPPPTTFQPKEDALEIRDRFALAALPALIAKATPSDILARDQAKVFSNLAYEIADAMMKERAQ